MTVTVTRKTRQTFAVGDSRKNTDSYVRSVVHAETLKLNSQTVRSHALPPAQYLSGRRLTADNTVIQRERENGAHQIDSTHVLVKLGKHATRCIHIRD